MSPDMEYIVDQVKAVLAIDSPTSYTKAAASYVLEEYRRLGFQPEMTAKGGVLVCLNPEAPEEDSLLLMAHLDTLGAMVAEIGGDGRLRLTNLGGMNPNNAEAENVRVVTRSGKVYTGTCQLKNASVHVNGDYSTAKRTWGIYQAGRGSAGHHDRRCGVLRSPDHRDPIRVYQEPFPGRQAVRGHPVGPGQAGGGGQSRPEPPGLASHHRI